MAVRAFELQSPGYSDSSVVVQALVEKIVEWTGLVGQIKVSKAQGNDF